MSKPQKLPSGSWRIQWLDADGKRQSATFTTYDLAKSELRRLEVETEDIAARRRRDPALASTVAEAYARYKATDKPINTTERRHARKWTRIDQHYRDHIGPDLGAVLLADLTPSRLKAWISTLAAKKTARSGEKNASGKTLSAASVRAAIVTLRQICKASDVPLQVILPDSLKQRTRVTAPEALQTADERAALVAACTGEPWFRVAVACGAYAGLRLGEVASLRWSSIREVDGLPVIAVGLSWEGPPKHRHEQPDADDGIDRLVLLEPELAEILSAWRKLTKGEDGDRVVLVNGGRPMDEATDTSMARRLKRACRRAGVSVVTFHELRASFATIAASRGVPLPALQASLGHRHLETTAGYIRPDRRKAALDPRFLSAHVLHTAPIADSANLN